MSQTFAVISRVPKRIGWSTGAYSVETRAVTFDVDSRVLGYYGPENKWVVEPGAFDLMVGGSSAQPRGVALDVVRDGQEIQLYVPRGPIGIMGGGRFGRRP